MTTVTLPNSLGTFAFGPSFADELIAAGLGGLSFSWSDNGSVSGWDTITPQQQSSLTSVAAAHNPNTLSAATQRKQAMQADPTLAVILPQLRTATAAQIDTFFTNNVTTNAQAIAVLKAVVKLLAYAVQTQ